MPLKLLVVFGTRPEAIKMAPLVTALQDRPELFSVQVCVTAQHRGMLDQVLDLFAIQPDIDLNLMRSGQDLYDVTSAVLVGLREVLQAQPPDVLLVHGDTTTTAAASMAGFYAGVPIGHVEAGLRTHDLQAPFPEEFNRRVASLLARWHFAPTARARDNLLQEGIPESAITVTGNTVVDALFQALARIDADPARKAALTAGLDARLSFAWNQQPFVLITGHRRENFGGGFERICQALRILSERHPAVHFVYPVHLNPNVQQPVRTLLSQLPNVHLIEPLGYESFILLLARCQLVLTDSGGLQEEAPSLGKPVLVMREVTERPEAVEAGTVALVGADTDRIVAGVSRLLEDTGHYQTMARAHNPYGDGQACSRIVAVLGGVELLMPSPSGGREA